MDTIVQGSEGILNLRAQNNNLSGCWSADFSPLCSVQSNYSFYGNNYDGVTDFISDSGWMNFCATDTGLCDTTASPIVLIEAEGGDIHATDANRGVILKSPNGSCFRIRINDDGSLMSESVTCP